MRKTWMALVVIALAVGCKSGRDDHGGVPAGAKVEEAKTQKPSAAMHVAAGDLAMSQKNADEALRQYQRALEIEPANQRALYNAATLHSYAGKFDQAISLWQRYVTATQTSSGALSNLGRAHELAGHWKDAEVAYVRALDADPKNKSARVNYGILLAKRDRSDEAEQQLGMVLVPAEVQYNLGSVAELRKDYPGAQDRYERALSFDPEFAVARQRLDLLKGVTSTTD